ncbi:MAG: transcriptional regulator PpsR, partial [Hyphomicrobiaceae bacterium]
LKKHVGDLEAEVAAKVISAASDFALIVDSDGVIKDFAFTAGDMPKECIATWVGRPWIETVTVESRSKVTEMLRDAGGKSTPRWRQVNHPQPRAADLPIRYSAIEVGRRGNVIALGRDLRPAAALQQRLIEAQQSTEREYARLRNAETRYRALFQLVSDPILIADASTLKVIEANPAALNIIGKASKKLVGRTLPDLFDSTSTGDLQMALSAARSIGQSGGQSLRLSDGSSCQASFSLFRQGATSHILLRLSQAGESGNPGRSTTASSNVMSVVQNMPDAFVLADPEHRILAVNTSFIELTQLATEEQATGQPLDRWIGRTSSEFGLMTSSLRTHGSIRNFVTVLRGELGSQEDVEVSAVYVDGGSHPCQGFTIRTTGRRNVAVSRPTDTAFPHSVNQLTSLVGTVPLKELVRETTDLIERLCIEAALDLADDNRVSAAEMLGVSRQSLYMKMRRFGIGDRDDDNQLPPA